MNIVDDEPDFTMPHLEYDREALDLLYPSVNAPQDVHPNMEDNWNSWDKMMQRGEDIVSEIRQRTIVEGRRRCEGGAQG